MEAIGWVLLGAIIASAFWWVKVRSLNGVISDLQDVGSDVKGVASKARSQ